MHYIKKIRRVTKWQIDRLIDRRKIIGVFFLFCFFCKSRLRFQRFISSMKGSHKTKASKHIVWLKIRQKSEGINVILY